ncbi:uncharacterized protein UV8b_01599 [Ustilaginoidea virens]|uniref:Uncharacterized protein n=1 Tax=Ustilaginoidea virens TaxID=1159556 RepID=A0A8E5MEJ4_USTVR|nr:uncharacterized protein UV8b_01599 [Ustilaginoidea virens]QUC17358.1 hypothetical protein UV8b_01599 [Ustilaginoidea virens]
MAAIMQSLPASLGLGRSSPSPNCRYPNDTAKHHRYSRSTNDHFAARIAHKPSAKSLSWLPRLGRSRPASPALVEGVAVTVHDNSDSTLRNREQQPPWAATHAPRQNVSSGAAAAAAAPSHSEKPPASDWGRRFARKKSQLSVRFCDQALGRDSHPAETSLLPRSASAEPTMPIYQTRRHAGAQLHDRWCYSPEPARTLPLLETRPQAPRDASKLSGLGAGTTSWLLEGQEPSVALGNTRSAASVPGSKQSTQWNNRASTASVSPRLDKALPTPPEYTAYSTIESTRKRMSKQPDSRLSPKQAKPSRRSVLNEPSLPDGISENGHQHQHQQQQQQQPPPRSGRGSPDSVASASSQQSDASATTDRASPSTAAVANAVVHIAFSVGSPTQHQHTFAPSPSPPPKNPERFLVSRRNASPPLAAISEGSEPRRRQPRDPGSDAIIYLPSTALCKAHPTFRHGHIAFLKSDAADADAAAADAAADGGGLAPGPCDDYESDLADDMAEWFDTFGFQTHGQLISEDPAPPPPPWVSSSSSQSLRSASPSTLNSEAEPPVPMMPVPVPVPMGPLSPPEPVRFFASQSPPRKWTPAPTALSVRDAQRTQCRLRSNSSPLPAA